jgi:hypothetical protein
MAPFDLTYLGAARICSIIVMLAGPKITMNKLGKIRKRVTTVSAINIGQPLAVFDLSRER